MPTPKREHVPGQGLKTMLLPLENPYTIFLPLSSEIVPFRLSGPMRNVAGRVFQAPGAGSPGRSGRHPPKPRLTWSLAAV